MLRGGEFATRQQDFLLTRNHCFPSSPFPSPRQAGQMTQIGVVEHLKLENVTLSHQLTETQHRSIKDKERIAVQLQSIEVLCVCVHACVC